MACFQYIATVYLFSVTASAQEFITCYQLDGCSGVSDRVIIQECCDNINGGGLGGIGLGASFQRDGTRECTPCPVVLGFIPSEFIGVEQYNDFIVQAGYLSGKPPVGDQLLFLQLILGTADENDVQTTTRIGPHPSDPLQSFRIALRFDGISQEFNETFFIEFSGIDVTDTSLFPIGAPVTVHRLNGTIIDQSRVEFELSEDDYQQSEEPDALMEVRIAKTRGRLANPIRFRVIPLTVIEAESMGIANYTRPADDDVSPSIADKNDFNASAISLLYPVDEISSVNDIPAFIPIVDDEIDEAVKQVFVVLLEVQQAVSSHLITISRNNSTCVIIDNEDVQIGFSQATYTVNEPDFETLITEVVLIREGGRLSEQIFSIAVTVSDPRTIGLQSATLQQSYNEDQSDYRIATSTQYFVSIRFSPREQNVTFFIFLYGDDFPEGTEVFRATSYSISSQSLPHFWPPSMGGAFASTEIHIIDDDLLLVQFQQVTYTVNEGDRADIRVFLTFAADQDVTVNFATIMGSAIAPGDYFSATGQVIFPAGVTSQTISVVTLNDSIVEPPEQFTASLFNPLPSSVQLGVQDTATVYIMDKEGTMTTGTPLYTECLYGRDPSTNCTQCFAGRDPSTDCVACLPGMYQSSVRAAECMTVSVNSLYGAIGVLSGCVLVLLIVSVVSILVCLLKHQKSGGMTSARTAEQPKESIEMMHNQVYGFPLKGTGQKTTTTDENVSHYEVTNDSKRNNPQTSQDGTYEYI